MSKAFSVAAVVCAALALAVGLFLLVIDPGVVNALLVFGLSLSLSSAVIGLRMRSARARQVREAEADQALTATRRATS